jgi:hypothetical protein
VEAALLLAAALHYEVLSARSETAALLAPLYPSVGGRFLGTAGEEALLRRGLHALSREAPPDWGRFLGCGQVPAAPEGLAAAWLLPARALQARHRVPLDLVALQAGCGLMLVADALMEGGEHLLVRRRVGLDPCPADVADPLVRRALRACAFPDQPHALSRLDAALQRMGVLRQVGRGPVLLHGEGVAGAWQALRLLLGEAGDGGPGRLLICDVHRRAAPPDDEEPLRRQAAIHGVLRAWRELGPATWIDIVHAGVAFVLDAYRLRDGALERLCLGRLAPSGALAPDPRGWPALTEESWPPGPPALDSSSGSGID